jgi:hypothetical protein
MAGIHSFSKGSSCALSGLVHIATDPGFRLAAPPWAKFLRRFAAFESAIGSWSPAASVIPLRSPFWKPFGQPSSTLPYDGGTR